MKYLLLLICLALVFFTGCDNREGEKPILSIIQTNRPLYNVANHDTLYIACQLAGSHELIANQKINVVYNGALGLFIGSGDANYLVTDQTGYARGLFKVEDGYYGNIQIQFSPEHFPGQAKTLNLTASDMPEITTFTASDSTLTSGETFTNITLTITSHSQNFMNQRILFTTNIGTSVDSLEARTDSSGTVHNVFRRNSFIGVAHILASVQIYPEDVHSLTVHCQ